MSVRIISDRPLPEWAEELAKDLGNMMDLPVTGYAIVGLMKPGTEKGPYVKYVNLCAMDRMICAGVIQYDLADMAAGDAIQRYMGTEDEEE